MIDASFDRMSRSAAISGVYQYDTGQRLRFSGLPSPEEFAEMDDLVSGSTVAVQVHYSYAGDSQSEMRLAQWNDARGMWMADIPDEYLTRNEPVYVHVYVYYGTVEPDVMMFDLGSAAETRAQTMYEGVFTPKSRPAPFGSVTDEQFEAWTEYAEEVSLVIADAEASVTAAQNAATGALAAAQTADDAAEEAYDAAAAAKAAADDLTDAGESIARASHSVIDLSPGETPTVVYAKMWNSVSLGIPAGQKGAAGDTGADGPTDIEIAFTDGSLTITPKEG